ncbi:MAG: hypothetical protein IJZ47_04920 [Oscillospiraceae bacterium]|nr:hypothetical protein [Oscillospiraceae bacterium]
MGRIIIVVLLFIAAMTGCAESGARLVLGERFGGIEVGSDNSYYTEIVALLDTRDSFSEVYDHGYGRPGAKLSAYEHQEQGYILGSLLDGENVVRFGLAMEQPPYPDVEGYEVGWAFFIYDSLADTWIYYDEDSCSALQNAVINAQHYELIGKTFSAEVCFNPTVPTEYTVRAAGVTYRIELDEPITAAKGELLEITILPQDEPLKWGDRLPASAKGLTE